MQRDFLIVLPVDPMPIGTVYPTGQRMPLHSTLMPWFGLSNTLTRASLEEKLGELARGLDITLISDRPEYFTGADNKQGVPVHALKPNETLMTLHLDILDFLHEHHATIRNIAHVGSNYRPHVTTVDGREFTSQRTHRVSEIVLIQRHGNTREVIQTFLCP
ncbi:MAG: hypothetical protein AAB388_03565 [Patescibacteria group bacterium]